MENKISEKVYKYRDWSNGFHKNVLLHNELYLASPKEINDPFDCRIAPNFIGLTLEEKKQYRIDFVTNQIEKAKIELGNESFLEDLERKMEDTVSFQEFYEKGLFELQDKRYGILSLSARWNRILLWSHYSNNHQGICIGFWTNQLRNFGPFVKYGEARYENDYPKNLKPIVFKENSEESRTQAFIQTHTKARIWRYEKEVRFLKIFDRSNPKPFERLIHFPNSVFAEVILGINISKEDREEIIQICKIKNIPVYQARKVPFKFAIDRELIE